MALWDLRPEEVLGRPMDEARVSGRIETWARTLPAAGKGVDRLELTLKAATPELDAAAAIGCSFVPGLSNDELAPVGVQKLETDDLHSS
ncbi:unnamed protein product [Parascedosporium putredinis]|uniref:Uncharacterized protein n=1 Tax=Parascedosporium putredinis TaxID=1442378 RepID=A0A9P1H7S8_9PEZI|nr:unnamed protein product [Parascedosporium putredinis]CAI7998958.1 unnamed protein product [Parascedosporium putredinis]